MHSLTNTTHHCLHCLGTIATTSRVTQLPLPLTSRHRHAVCGRHTGCAPPGGRSHRHVLRPSCAASPLGASANPGNRAASAASTSLPIRIIGIGPRAANVLPRLADPNTGVSPDVHYIDWDAKQIEGAYHTALLKADGAQEGGLEDLLDTGDIDRMCGPVVFEDGTAGCAVVFVLASATDGPPGAARATAELTRALRNAGHFTVAVLTLPFEFEGQKKNEAGGALVEELQDIAHTTVAVEQALLTANTQGMTVTAAQAMGIADGALEHAVRGVASALRVPELLVLANGGAAWHGKARGNLRQRMSTPLQQLLTRPGTVALGRGLAGMRAPLPTDGTALQCLAADAVAAAADSPFLQGGLKDAAGLLCCISLPASAQGAATARLAVQAAAGGLMEALGNSPVAKNMLICAHGADGDGEREGVAVEATIMVVRPPQGNHALPSTRIQMAPPPPKSKAVVPPRRAAGTSAAAAAPGTRLPSSVWGAMSALAGGTAVVPPPPAAPRPTPSKTPSQPPTAPSAPRTPVSMPEPLPSPASNVVPVRSQPHPPPRTRPLLRPNQLPSQSTTAPPPSPSSASKDSTIGDLLASSLNVRSLDLPRHTPDAPPQWPDLPPRAAIWRMQQRPVLEVTEEVEDEGGAMSGWLPWASGRKGAAHPPSQASARAWSILGDEGEDF